MASTAAPPAAAAAAPPAAPSGAAASSVASVAGSSAPPVLRGASFDDTRALLRVAGFDVAAFVDDVVAADAARGPCVSRHVYHRISKGPDSEAHYTDDPPTIASQPLAPESPALAGYGHALEAGKRQVGAIMAALDAEWDGVFGEGAERLEWAQKNPMVKVVSMQTACPVLFAATPVAAPKPLDKPASAATTARAGSDGAGAAGAAEGARDDASGGGDAAAATGKPSRRGAKKAKARAAAAAAAAASARPVDQFGAQLIQGAAPAPEGAHFAALHDVKVYPPGNKDKKKGAGPPTDDAIYAEFPEIRERVPRGLTLLELNAAVDPVGDGAAEGAATDVAAAGGADGDGAGAGAAATAGAGEAAGATATASAPATERRLVVPVIVGMKKFVGGMGDEDDEEDDGGAGADSVEYKWQRFFTGSVEDCKHIVSTGKANGEAGHFAVRYVSHADAFVFIAGSKNVHLAVTSSAELDQPCYADVDRFRVAIRVARTILRVVESMPAETARQFKCFMANTWLTMIVELLDPESEHVELFPFAEPRVSFIAFVAGGLHDVPGLDKCLNPLLGFKLAEHFGFQPVTHEVAPFSDLDTIMLEVRKGYGIEGLVLYFLDGAGDVMGLLKKKTVWYIVIRAIREKNRTMARRIQKLNEEAAKIRDTWKPPAAAATGDGGAGKKNKRGGRNLSLAKLQERGPSALPDLQQAEYDFAVTRVTKRMAELKKWLGLSTAAVSEFTMLARGVLAHSRDGMLTGMYTFDDLASHFPRVWHDCMQRHGWNDRFDLGLSDAAILRESAGAFHAPMAPSAPTTGGGDSGGGGGDGGGAGAGAGAAL